jgi:hypothetical protein
VPLRPVVSSDGTTHAAVFIRILYGVGQINRPETAVVQVPAVAVRVRAGHEPPILCRGKGAGISRPLPTPAPHPEGLRATHLLSGASGLPLHYNLKFI